MEKGRTLLFKKERDTGEELGFSTREKEEEDGVAPNPNRRMYD